ncbi:MAG: DUF2795 domain-containing protein, partial [Pseudonocardiales bacterium]|nr:DUF2795 domain-containing protein [Pseudonocardiales bacterium]
MMRRSSRADVARVRHVLAGVTFPAAKWQLIIHAEDYGADATTRTDLWRLPAGVYPDIQAVLAALGMVAAPAPREGYRSAPSAQAAAR